MICKLNHADKSTSIEILQIACFLQAHFCSIGTAIRFHEVAISQCRSESTPYIDSRLGPMGEAPMDKITKTEIWDLAAGTFIVVSVVSGMAFIIASAI
jgi:hypothetical protein